QGCCLSITLPLNSDVPAPEQPTSGAAADTSDSSAQSSDQNHILVVEDDPAIRMFLEDFLDFNDLPALIAESGEEALTIIDQQHTAISLVISDMNMPGISGSEVIDHLRQRCPKTPVILTTGDPTSRSAQTAAQQAQVTLLSKPFTGTALLQAITSQLG
ncbi:MAG: response regulator, partial [Planctomycetota bacterium]